jgi:hypothetical protein
MVGQKEVSQRSFATKGPGKFKGDIERDSGQQLDKSGIARLVTRQGSKTKTKGWTRKGPEMASLTGKEVRMAQMARTERVRLGSPTLESTDEYSQRPEESDAAFAGRINTERQKKGRTRIELVGKNIADARRKGANPGGGRYKNLMPNAKSKEE